jgi:hypothetical protein
MNKERQGIPRRGILFLVAIVLLIPMAAIAQDEESGQKRVDCNPVSQGLADEMGIDCLELVDLQNSGVGLGEIMTAWHLSQSLDSYRGEWQTLLEIKQQDIGWGQFKMAYRLADANNSPEQLLALKQSGLGWGQIWRAQTLTTAEFGLSFDQSLALIEGDLGWGEIQDQLGLPPGPPPWARGSKTMENQGKPPWVNGNKAPTTSSE